MALACSCGWVGANLVPSPSDNTARCPKCHRVFQGIPAADAIHTPGLDEKVREGLEIARLLGEMRDHLKQFPV